MRRLSMIILGVAVFTMSAEALNQYTTLLGWSQGFRENDPTARYLLSTNPILETVAVLSIPVCLLLVAYVAGVRWRPVTPKGKMFQKSVATIALVLSVLLGISTTMAAFSDLNTLHAYGFLGQSILKLEY